MKQLVEGRPCSIWRLLRQPGPDRQTSRWWATPSTFKNKPDEDLLIETDRLLTTHHNTFYLITRKVKHVLWPVSTSPDVSF